MKLHKEIVVLQTELEQLKQLVRSLRGLVNRKLGYTDESNNETETKNARFNNDVILPM